MAGAAESPQIMPCGHFWIRITRPCSVWLRKKSRSLSRTRLPRRTSPASSSAGQQIASRVCAMSTPSKVRASVNELPGRARVDRGDRSKRLLGVGHGCARLNFHDAGRRLGRAQLAVQHIVGPTESSPARLA